VVEFPKEEYLYDADPGAPPFSINNEGLYGVGYTYSHWLNQLDDNVDRSNLAKRIKLKEFDLVVYGAIHRGLPFFDLVTSNYDKKDIIFIDGEDSHGWCTKSSRYASKGWWFMREIPDGCPPAVGDNIDDFGRPKK